MQCISKWDIGRSFFEYIIFEFVFPGFLLLIFWPLAPRWFSLASARIVKSKGIIIDGRWLNAFFRCGNHFYSGCTWGSVRLFIRPSVCRSVTAFHFWRYQSALVQSGFESRREGERENEWESFWNWGSYFAVNCLLTSFQVLWLLHDGWHSLCR